MTKEDVLAFIKTKTHMVISTCGENHRPQSALMGFGETDQLELIFGTQNMTRKYKNLVENSFISCVIGWDDDLISVQYEGVASQIKPEEVEKYSSLYFKKVPSAANYKSHPGQTYWLVKPTWIRYIDLKAEPEGKFEFTF